MLANNPDLINNAIRETVKILPITCNEQPFFPLAKNMLRQLYRKNFLFSKTIWHQLNEKVLSNSARQALLIKWDKLVRFCYLALGKQYFIKKRNNAFLLLDINNLIDLRVASRGNYEAEQQSYFVSQIRANNCSIFCDIGANWGMYSLEISKLGCVSDVFAFEPDYKNRTQLEANIFLNQYHDKIKVYPFAISSFSGKATFSSTNSQTEQLENRGTAKLSSEGDASVEVRTLDELLTIKNQTVALKIDIEGNELEAINGMQEFLKNNQCIMQVEAFKSTKDTVLQTMENSGYTLIHTIGNDYYFSNI